GLVVLPGDSGFSDLIGLFPAKDGTRSVIVVDVERIADSCGYGVPRMPFERHRDNLDHWAAQKTPAELTDYRAGKNAVSIDGLPALA
ncbi:MAG TPA: pyridoxamine 5'-phosphate oxidase family protein, partial [Acidimicrobiia bacterium]|nr:pyridoxamine 5'-phosphate oxidase family protein [Acidimicrobiia bacterium]